MSSTVDPPRSGSPTGHRLGISQDTVFKILSARRRRYILHYLLEEDRTVGLRELSEQVAAWENDIPRSEVTRKQRMRTYTAFRQSHLPKMDVNGIVAFDEDRGQITATPVVDELERYLQPPPQSSIRWHRYYVAEATLGLVAVIATTQGLVPVSTGLTAIVTLTVILSSALVHAYSRRNSARATDRLAAIRQP